MRRRGRCGNRYRRHSLLLLVPLQDDRGLNRAFRQTKRSEFAREEARKGCLRSPKSSDTGVPLNTSIVSSSWFRWVKFSIRSVDLKITYPFKPALYFLLETLPTNQALKGKQWQLKLDFHPPH